MKVSIIHAERRSAQMLAIDGVAPHEGAAHEFPERLLPTERYEFVVPLQQLCAFVASAPLKQHGPAPLVIELEAEEGETLHSDTLQVFVLNEPRPYSACYPEAAIEEGKLDRLPAPLTLAGDRQQFGIATIDVFPSRDLLIVVTARAALPACAP